MSVEATNPASGDMVLHVVWCPFEPVAHVVSAATIAQAAALDASPMIVDFGDLRRFGEIDVLEQRLEDNGEATLDEYVSAIEESAGQEPVGTTLTERLANLVDVIFDGLTEDEFDPDEGLRFIPGDDDDCGVFDPSEDPAEEFRGYELISKAMSNDIPPDLLAEFGSSTYGNSPAFSGHIDDRVEAERLDDLISALEARGYTVVRDDQ